MELSSNASHDFGSTSKKDNIRFSIKATETLDARDKPVTPIRSLAARRKKKAALDQTLSVAFFAAAIILLFAS